MIAIIDYGSGNLRSVYNAFKALGAEAKVISDAASLKKAERIVLPGVGSSKDAIVSLGEKGLAEALLGEINRGKLFLGICLGLQLLFESSEEAGGVVCLGLLKGKVKLFPAGKGIKVPQIGWNTVKLAANDCPIFDGIKDGSYFYFVHSYYCDSREREWTVGMTEYGVNYASAVHKDNIFAVQFHPERSQGDGLRILENFVNL